MKTLYTVLGFILLSGNCGLRAQPGTDAFQPPKEISERFRKEYPGITPTWQVEQNYYVASFSDTNSFKGRAIAYDHQGRIMRREAEMENSTYPAKINDYFVKNYPGEKFRTYQATDLSGQHSYCIKRSEGTLWFDQDGNYLDPVKKNEQATAAND